MGKDRYSHQVAALPIRLDDERRVEVCLVTSRTTGRWIIPKGWPMKGLRDDEAAKVEAEEEAGLVGAMLKPSLGAYTYWRRTRSDFRLTQVDVYVLRVTRQKKRWKERSQRMTTWAPYRRPPIWFLSRNSARCLSAYGTISGHVRLSENTNPFGSDRKALVVSDPDARTR